MNSILVIHPYREQGVWVFDDERVGLVREPFVCGADAIIDQMVAGIPDAERGVTLYFSGQPFPGATFEFVRRDAESGGYWYFSESLNMTGWLCPALFKYFDEAPERLFVQVQPRRM